MKMTVENYSPTDILKPFIKAFRVIESHDELENRILPNTSLTLAFRFFGKNTFRTHLGKEELSTIAFSGLRKSVRLINYSQNTSTLVVMFTECGASAFFREPLHELFESTISLDSLISAKEVADVEELLGEAKTNFLRVQIVEQFLRRRIIYRKDDNLVLEAVRRIKQSNGLIKMKALAEELYLSQDAFEKRFRKVVGSSPKQFASIARMSSIIRQMPDSQILNVALDAGYYDQAHFNKDFKLFTGLTPTVFYKTASYW